MTSTDESTTIAFLANHHPFDALPAEAIATIASTAPMHRFPPGHSVYEPGAAVDNLFVVFEGIANVVTPDGEVIAEIPAGDSFGARPMLRGGRATNRVVAMTALSTLVVPRALFEDLRARFSPFQAYFDRAAASAHRRSAPSVAATTDALAMASLAEIMTPDPIGIAPEASVREAATLMGARKISCLLVNEADGSLAGILTSGDLAARIVAAGRSPDTPVSAVMTPAPFSLGPDALLVDALSTMAERGFGHLPVVVDGKAVGIVTSTNLVRRQSVSAVHMIADIAKLSRFEDLAGVVARVPMLLAQMVGIGVDAWKIGHVVTNVTDALTRRLIALATAKLGPAPVPFLWLACGSQGRQEQTGVSDQDNCLIIDDAYDPASHSAYFEGLARFVSDGLNAAGYVYCPGDMMATNPKWRQPLATWRTYFRGWIARPDPMAQMLSSVMFDLRPIAGETALFAGLQRETLEAARKNSIFRAHMIANSLKHAPPIGLFRGFALIRSGEHKDTLDLKHAGIVPIVDLARVYALDGAIEVVNTRARLLAAQEAGTLSESGGEDLLDAYDLIAGTRLEHQARQIRAGRKPDNFLAPSTLSALERAHLRDAFGVVKTLQSALSQTRGLV